MRKFAMLLAALMALFSLSAPAQASEWTNWTRMNPDSYKVTMAEMTNRCLTSVALTGEGSKAECEEVAAMLLANQCQFVPVPDGVRYGWMNGLKAGQPHVYIKMVKAIGAARKAYVCKTSSGRVFDWYVGEDGISCGNLGAREFTPPVLTYFPPAAPPLLTTIVPPAITTSVVPGSEADVPGFPFYGWGAPAPSYSGGNTNIVVGSRSRSSATNTNPGGCTTACTPPRTH